MFEEYALRQYSDVIIEHPKECGDLLPRKSYQLGITDKEKVVLRRFGIPVGDLIKIAETGLCHMPISGRSADAVKILRRNGFKKTSPVRIQR